MRSRHSKPTTSSEAATFPTVVLVGMAAGFLSGMFGVGGGNPYCAWFGAGRKDGSAHRSRYFASSGAAHLGGFIDDVLEP